MYALTVCSCWLAVYLEPRVDSDSSVPQSPMKNTLGGEAWPIIQIPIRYD